MRRKAVILSIVGFIAFLSSFSGANTEQPKAFDYLAVMDLKCSGGAADLEGPLTDVVIEEIFKSKKFIVIDRANRDRILAEVGFQMSGCVGERCVIEAGQILGVGRIVVGSVSKVGNTYLVSLQLISVQTSTVEAVASETCDCDFKGLINTIRLLSQKLMGGSMDSEASAPTSSGNVGICTGNNPFIGRKNIAHGEPVLDSVMSTKRKDVQARASINDGLLDSCWELPKGKLGWVEVEFNGPVKIGGLRFKPRQSGYYRAYGKHEKYPYDLYGWGVMRSFRIVALTDSKETLLCGGEVTDFKKPPQTIPPGLPMVEIEQPQWMLCQTPPVETSSIRIYVDSIHGEYAGICEVEIFSP